MKRPTLVALALILAATALPGRTITGQAYGKGFDGPYLFAGIEIALYPRSIAKREFAENVVRVTLPEPRATTTTDAEGRFSIELPPGDWLLYARASRNYRSGHSAGYEWRVALWETRGDVVTLNEENRHFFPGRGIEKR